MNVEECPNCGNVFSSDEGDYHPSGHMECPKCHQELDAKHDNDYRKESGVQQEVSEFDKFMDKIVEREETLKLRNENVMEDTPARLYQKRYKEYHNNRIVYRRGK